jgi:hypothetical protein
MGSEKLALNYRIGKQATLREISYLSERREEIIE